MHIRIREITNIDKISTNCNKDVYLNVSKSTTIKCVQEMIENVTNVKVGKQKLYHRGKELRPEYRITDYNIHLNDVVQLVVKTDKLDDKPSEVVKKQSASSKYYEIGDKIDLFQNGSWIEAKIVDIQTLEVNSNSIREEDLIFKTEIDRGVQSPIIEASFNEIRPRSFHVLKKSELSANMEVLINYNAEKPWEKGDWCDFRIIKINSKTIRGKILHDDIQASVKMGTKMFRIEKPVLIGDKNGKIPNNIKLRPIKAYCDLCLDNISKICPECGCKKCEGKEDIGILLVCDECGDHFHLQCLEPPLTEVPPEPEWFCPLCRINPTEIIQAGAPPRLSRPRKQQKAVEWGKGMACVSRTTDCTLVSKSHFGPIPGVEVGTCWKYRLQVSEAGVHRPLVAGIHGRENEGAFSLILSGGYEDDVDFGDEFFYTGSGGRDLSGGRRKNKQSFDQKLVRMNKALAMNCHAEFNDVEGAESIDWRKGKPVRVVRNYKLEKHSKYAPKEGNRYDGIYKVVKYFPQKGKSGFLVWRYLLKRDDLEPAPWEPNGKELDVIYPEGYCEALEAQKNSGTKRKAENFLEENSSTKKIKEENYEIPQEIKDFIQNDVENKEIWQGCQKLAPNGKNKFLKGVEENFMCVCCRELVYEAVTTSCKHNICQVCLKQSFQAEIYTCPMCRFDFTKNYKFEVNVYLSSALKMLFPGYGKDR